MFELYRRLPRDIYVLFAAQIVNSLGNFVYPFMALLLTEKAGISAGRAGVYITLAAVSFVPGSLIAGRLADRFGRKRLIVIGFVLVAVTFVACGFLNNMLLLPWFIIVAEMSFGLIHPTLQALTTDLTTPENRRAAFSLTYLGHNIGFAVGPLIAGFLFTRNIRLMFYGDAATSLFAAFFIVLWVTESIPDEEELERIKREQPKEQSEEGSIWGVLYRRPLVLCFMLVTLVLSFIYAQYTFALPLFLQEVFADRGAEVYGFIMTANAIVVVACTALVIGATKGLRPATSVGISALLYAVGFGAIYFGRAVPFFLATAVVWTVGEILSATNIDVYIANHTPASHRGRMNAVAPIIIETGFAVSPLLMGRYIDRFGARLVWPLSGALALVAAAGYFTLRLVDRKSHHIVLEEGAS